MATTCLASMSPQFPVSSGVTVHSAPHGANSILNHQPILTGARDLLQASCPKEFKKIRNDNLIQSSFSDAEERLLEASNGFVDSAVVAYSNHHHLIIRPEDVWFSVLVQINIYINAHAEEMRSMFVEHRGQKKLVIKGETVQGKGKSNWGGVDFAKFAYQMGKLIEENIIDPPLREWFMPEFSTTTKSDQATASIIMMSAMQKYFTYECSITCGLPSVTLLGRKEDWEKILYRLERLKTFGDEPTQWYNLLKPVFTKFVETFDDPQGQTIKDFWQTIAHYESGGSGPTYLSGWITAFCFWDADGKLLSRAEFKARSEDEIARGYHPYNPALFLSLNGVRYHSVETTDVPAGWASVPVTLDYFGDITNAIMVAGSVGMHISSSGLKLHSENGATGLDSIQPASGWWMYETMNKEELLDKARQEYEGKREEYTWLKELKGTEVLAWFEDKY